MKNNKVIEIIKQNKIYYFFAVIATFLDSYFQLLVPAITGFVAEGVLSKYLNIQNQYEPPKYLQSYVNFFGGNEEIIDKIWVFSLLITIIGVLIAVVQYVKGRMTSTASENVSYSIRNQLYDKLMKVEYKYYSTMNSGDIIQRCNSDVNLVRMFFGGSIIEVVRVISITTFAIIMMTQMNVKLTIYSTMLLPVILFVSIYVRKMLEKRQVELEDAESKFTTNIQETVNGIRVIKAFNNQNLEIERFKKLNKNLFEKLKNILVGQAFFWSITDLVCLTQFLIVVVSCSIASSKGELSLGEFIIFTTYTLRLIWPIRFTSRIFAEYNKTKVAMRRINEILEAEEEDLETGEKPEITGDIEFKDLNFVFKDNKNAEVLKNINLKINKGEKVGILGATGSGKSTLMHLLLRLYDYENGNITLNGVELKNINKTHLRENISIVLQDNFLFAKSIFQNIKIANNNANLDNVQKVAKIANIHETIESFENGYETLVGEKGVTLSGGQKQRTTIARTLIRNSNILIFDDSLSAVDVETDQKIREKLSKHNKNLTTIIIAQRINTLIDCDKIVVMDKGQITHVGTHKELITQDGLYKKVWDIQNLDSDEEYIK